MFRFKTARSLYSWKVDQEQKVLFVFDGKSNEKATHALKVYVNGVPTKCSHEDTKRGITV
jgi:hypothetical protein